MFFLLHFLALHEEVLQYQALEDVILMKNKCRNSVFSIQSTFYYFDGLCMCTLQLSIVNLIDPSEHLRPELKFAAKALECFRDYSIDENNPIKERVRKTYLEMHTNQTMHFVTDRIQQWTSFSTFKVCFPLSFYQLLASTFSLIYFCLYCLLFMTMVEYFTTTYCILDALVSTI